MLVLIQVAPFVAYISSVVLWLGSGDPPVRFMTALVCLPAFVFAAVAGMRSADPASRELFASVDASRWQVLWRLRLPSALPSLFTTARYNIGLALVVAYLVEGSNFADEGLGAIGKREPRPDSVGDAVWATVFCMVVLGTIGLIVIGLLERWLLHWHASQRVLTPSGPDRVRSLAWRDELDGRPLLAARPDRSTRPRVRSRRGRTAGAVRAGGRGQGALGHAGHPARSGARRRHVAPATGHRCRASIPTSPSNCSACLLAETHRIEVAGHRPDPAPDKVAAPDGIRSGLDTVATRIDHVVVAVADLDAAVAIVHRLVRVPPDAARRRRRSRASPRSAPVA